MCALRGGAGLSAADSRSLEVQPTSLIMGGRQQTREKGDGVQGVGPEPLDSLSKPERPAGREVYGTVDEAVAGLSRRLGHEVDAHFVTAFFVKDPRGALDLPPKPRADPELCKEVSELITPVNVGARDEREIRDFLRDVFKVGAGKRLSSYELQLLEFVVRHKDTIEFQFDLHSRDHAHERPESGDRRVVLGGTHHSLDRPYTPQEAWSTFLHEIAHSRETTFGLGSRNNATGVVLSEVNANIYGSFGDVRKGISETAILYRKRWEEVSANMPGFSQLAPPDQYRYLSILCRDDRPPEIAFAYNAEELKEAFPQLANLVDKRREVLLEVQERNIPVIEDSDFDDDD